VVPLGVAGVAIASLAVMVYVGATVTEYSTQPTPTGARPRPVQATGRVPTTVAAGAHDFVRFACAQCHGLDGRGGV
jgi:hypothetical protein